MTIARISEIERKTTQSGKANTGRWLLEFERQQPQRPDPLTGWNGSGDTNPQVRLTFPTKEAAIAYCDKHGLELPRRPGAAGAAQDPGLRRQLPLRLRRPCASSVWRQIDPAELGGRLRFADIRLVIGTRPEAIKLAPVAHALAARGLAPT